MVGSSPPFLNNAKIPNNTLTIMSSLEEIREQKKLAALNQDPRHLQDSIDKLNGEIVGLRTEYLHAMKKYNDIKDKYDQQEKYVKRLTDTLHMTKEKLKGLQGNDNKKIVPDKERIKELEKKIVKMQKNYDKLFKENQDQVNMIIEQNQTINNLNQQVANILPF